MKTIFKILTIGLLCFSLQTSAQTITTVYSAAEIEQWINMFDAMTKFDAYPREVVLKQFKKDFPKAKNVYWYVAAGIYQADFNIGKKENKAYYDTNGNLLKHTVETKK